jgi:hypothetical protein
MFGDPMGFNGYNYDEYYDAMAGPDEFWHVKKDEKHYHKYRQYKLLFETDKAYFLKASNGHPFWCPKSLWKMSVIKKGEIKGWLYKFFQPKYLPKLMKFKNDI